MNSFENQNTGHWRIEEDRTGYRAVCNFCGSSHSVYVNKDWLTLKVQVAPLHDTCPICHKDMFKEESKIVIEPTEFGESHFAIGQGVPQCQELVINCDKITLEQKSLDISFNISNKVENFDKVTINGITFVREIN